MARKSNTRAPQGSGTIRQRKDGLWEARFTPGRDPGSGKQIQRSFYGKSQEEVRKKLNRVQTEKDDGIYIDPVKITVGQWADIWLKEYLGEVKETTREQYLYQIEVHIKPHLGAVKLSAVTPPMIQHMYNTVMKPRKIGIKGKDGKMVKKSFRGISAKSVKNLHGVCHRMFAQAVMLQYIHANPCDPCKLPRCEKVDIRPITEEYFKPFLDAIKKDPYGDLFFVDVFTGMRQGEIIGLTWDCVNFISGTITVKHQLQQIRHRGGGSEYKFAPTKNDKIRVLQPAPDVMKALQRVKSKQAEWKLAAGETWNNEDNLVFTDELGNHLIDNTVLKHFKRIVTMIGIPNTRFHDLRHTYATNALKMGDSIKVVSENLGHSTVAFTLNVYGHVTPQMKQDSADRMQRLIDSCN